MNDHVANLILYVKHTCPFCFKVRLFLLESGQLGSVELQEATTPGEVDALRSELGAHIDNFTFPVVRFGPGDYVTDSDAIIKRLEAHFDIQESLPTFQAYITGPFTQVLDLHRKVSDLERLQAAQG